jgi:microsomal dipeptidase-like Zn-dependent dipeptidase
MNTIVKNTNQLDELINDVDYVLDILSEDGMSSSTEFEKYIGVQDALHSVSSYPTTIKNLNKKDYVHY